eukprot:scaffold116151_cov19-Tisochrysis_lutea.AAC.1
MDTHRELLAVDLEVIDGIPKVGIPDGRLQRVKGAKQVRHCSDVTRVNLRKHRQWTTRSYQGHVQQGVVTTAEAAQ